MAKGQNKRTREPEPEPEEQVTMSDEEEEGDYEDEDEDFDEGKHSSRVKGPSFSGQTKAEWGVARTRSDTDTDTDTHLLAIESSVTQKRWTLAVDDSQPSPFSPSSFGPFS